MAITTPWKGVPRKGPVSSSLTSSAKPVFMYYVYFLLLKNGNIYTGSSDDLRRRIAEHQNGKVKSTQYFRPVELIGYEAYLIKSDAARREKFFKTTEGKRLFRQQYKDILSRVRPIIR